MKTERTIRNCKVSFKFQCPLKWEALQSTEDDAIRFCDQCREKVYYCATDAETIEHARAGHCVARLMPEESQIPLMIGRPRIEDERMQILAKHRIRREHEINESIQNLPTISSCPKCGYPIPDHYIRCKICEYS
ncbi:MAG: hypothetical protein RL095_1840 [Verrucomicrobiota bacterium]|jgi:MinD superfamily P-loop ATPase